MRRIVLSAIVVLLLLVSVQGAFAQGAGAIQDARSEDSDNDGFIYYADCDDNVSAINPSATDIGDGIDNNCDGVIDPDLPLGWYQVVDSTHTAGGITNTSAAKKQVRMQGQKAMQSEWVPAVAGHNYRGSILAECTSGAAAIALRGKTANGQVPIGIQVQGSTGTISILPTALPEDVTHIALRVLTIGSADCLVDNATVSEGGATVRALSTNEVPSNCCGANSCWNGTKCVGDQSNNALAAVDGYRCIQGIWTQGMTRSTPQGDRTGFCPGQSQCLFEPNPNLATADANNMPEAIFQIPSRIPHCIANGQFVFDRFCESGNWSTRTKVLAVQMLDYLSQSKPEYTLFCDKPSVLFGSAALDRSIFTNECTASGGGVRVPCVNNMCVGTFAQKNAIGVTLNTAPNDPEGFLNALGGKNVCDGKSGSGYVKCGSVRSGQFDVWYNNQTSSLIVLPAGENLVSVTNLIQAFLTRIFDELQPIWDYVFGGTSQLEQLEFFSSARAYDRLYAAKSGNTKVFAFLEENRYPAPGDGPYDMIAIKYENFNGDICPVFDQYKTNIPAVRCDESTTGIATMVTYRDTGLQVNPAITAWTDLTAKLRYGDDGND